MRRSGDAARVLPFRRSRQRVRRLRPHPLRRWVKPLAGAVVIVGAPAAAAAWLLVSPRLSLAEVVVVAGERVDEGWLRRTLAPFRGRNLLRLDLGEVERRIARHPWVAGVELRKELPGRLHVEVHERRAAALLEEGDELLYVDADGRPIVPYAAADGPADLPLVSRAAGVSSAAPALALAREIAAVDPPWAAGLSEIEVLGETDCRVYTASLPYPLLLRLGTVAVKAPPFAVLRPVIDRRFGAVAAVDLRFDRRVVVEPLRREAVGS